MAGNVGDSSCRLDGGLAKEVQKELGLLAVSLEQRTVGRLGSASRSICAYRPAGLSCLPEYQGNYEEQFVSINERQCPTSFSLSHRPNTHSSLIVEHYKCWTREC
jgi:hypothetical protein